MHEQPDDGVGAPPVVDQAHVVAGVAGRHGVDVDGEGAQRHRDPVGEAVGDGDSAVGALVGLCGDGFELGGRPVPFVLRFSILLYPALY